MSNISFTSKNNCEVNGAFLVTAESLSVDEGVGSKTLMGNAGNMGILISSGSDLTGTIVFNVPSSGMELDLDAWRTSDTGYNLVFTAGSNRYLLSGARAVGRSFNSSPGAPSYSVGQKFRAADFTRIA